MGFACAIEMIHTYSLVHDDLPAMDNDDYRRGKLTNHKVYGEAMAILAGDALLNKAFEVALEESVKLNLEEDKIIKSLMVLANLSGTEGMIGGQVVDLVSERKEIDIDILKYMHYMKTGALIRCAAKIGCIIGGANEQQMDLIGEYANNLGLAFQIKDDILDVVGNPEKIGKPIGSDRGNNKSTFVTLMGIDKSKKFEKELTKKSIESMKSFGYQSEFLVSLANYLLNRDY
jgi:geranylgeranyl diphosphate synthase type II